MAWRVSILAFGLLVLSVPAFWPRYLSTLGTADAYTHTHAALGTAWLLLLIAQPLLVHFRKLRAHRWLGRAGCAIGAGFVLAGILLTHRSAARMDAAEFARWGYSMYLPLSMTAIFAAALVLGIRWRSVPAVHGRFMACTTIPLLDPIFARILGFNLPQLPGEWLYQVPAFTIAAVMLLAWSRSLPRATPGRRDFHAFAIATVAVLLAFFLTPESGAWLAFVAWFRGLPIT